MNATLSAYNIKFQSIIRIKDVWVMGDKQKMRKETES